MYMYMYIYIYIQSCAFIFIGYQQPFFNARRWSRAFALSHRPPVRSRQENLGGENSRGETGYGLVVLVVHKYIYIYICIYIYR